MVKAWTAGRYRVIPWRSLCILAVVTLYAINPFDIIPDYVPFFGVVDDAAMVGLLWRSLRKDAVAFREWETQAIGNE
jgi:uncharacterized membrane protein YkvA (DUF1232 family)